MMDAYREPTEQEIDAVLDAIDEISRYIGPLDGAIFGDGWRIVHKILSSLSDFEIWLGLYNLEAALFDSGEPVTVVRAALYQLFQIAYDQGIEAL